jgi:hypothetical protein
MASSAYRRVSEMTGHCSTMLQRRQKTTPPTHRVAADPADGPFVGRLSERRGLATKHQVGVASHLPHYATLSSVTAITITDPLASTHFA